MPCNQMISMNCRPPRPTDDISPARLPMPNDADRNSRMLTIGWATRSSMKQKATISSSPTDDRAEHPRVGPPGRRIPVRLDAIGDAGEQRRQPDAEGERARPVQPAGSPHAEFLQRPVAPDGAEHADRHADPEDGLPVPLRQHAADQQAEERPGDRGHHVDAQRHATLVGRERVGEDRRPTTPSASRRRRPGPPASRSATSRRRRGGTDRRTARSPRR